MRVLMVGFLLFIACSSTPAEKEIAMGESFQLKPGEVAVVAGTKLKFVAVDGDSRCPEGVQCVWEGNALLRFAVGDQAREVTLDTSKGNVAISPTSQLVFEALEPARAEGTDIPQTRYRARVRVEPLATS